MKFIKTDQTVVNLTASLARNVIEVTKTVTVPANSSYGFVSVVNYDQYDIRTVTAKTDTGDPVTLSIFDGNAQTNELYRSLSQAVISDLVSIPFRDKSGEKSMYVRLVNQAVNIINVTLTITAVTL